MKSVLFRQLQSSDLALLIDDGVTLALRTHPRVVKTSKRLFKRGLSNLTLLNFIAYCINLYVLLKA